MNWLKRWWSVKRIRRLARQSTLCELHADSYRNRARRFNEEMMTEIRRLRGLKREAGDG